MQWTAAGAPNLHLSTFPGTHFWLPLWTIISNCLFIWGNAAISPSMPLLPTSHWSSVNGCQYQVTSTGQDGEDKNNVGLVTGQSRSPKQTRNKKGEGEKHHNTHNVNKTAFIASTIINCQARRHVQSQPAKQMICRLRIHNRSDG